jgi:L-aminopeptidase/D-esterase-like protein
MKRLLTILLTVFAIFATTVVMAPRQAQLSAQAQTTPTSPSCQAQAPCVALVDEVGQAAARAFARATVHALLAAKTVTGNSFGAGTAAVLSYCDKFAGACGTANDGYPNLLAKTGQYNNITDVPGIQAGLYTDPNVLTGTTAFIMRSGATVGIEVRGSAPGGRETDVLKDQQVAQPINAVVLSGGSSYGLAAADGVVQWLEQNHIGLSANGGQGVVPIVPEAIIFDPGRFGPFTVHPTADFGYKAAQAAHTGPLDQGNIGSGAGAEAGSLKGGLGFASEDLGDGIFVGAAVTINSVGDGYDPGTGCQFYGAQFQLQHEFAGVIPPPGGCGSSSTGVGAASAADHAPVRNTTIGVVATNLAMDKAMVNQLASYGQDGMALAIRPSHTMLDGDTVMSISTGTVSRSSPTDIVPAPVDVPVPDTGAGEPLVLGVVGLTGGVVLTLQRPRRRRRLEQIKAAQRRDET